MHHQEVQMLYMHDWQQTSLFVSFCLLADAQLSIFSALQVDLLTFQVFFIPYTFFITLVEALALYFTASLAPAKNTINELNTSSWQIYFQTYFLFIYWLFHFFFTGSL